MVRMDEIKQWELDAYQGLFGLLVLVGLEFDEGAEDVLVLVGVLVPQQHRQGFVVHSGLFEILQFGVGVALPELLQFVDLLRSDLCPAECANGCLER